MTIKRNKKDRQFLLIALTQGKNRLDNEVDYLDRKLDQADKLMQVASQIYNPWKENNPFFEDENYWKVEDYIDKIFSNRMEAYKAADEKFYKVTAEYQTLMNELEIEKNAGIKTKIVSFFSFFEFLSSRLKK